MCRNILAFNNRHTFIYQRGISDNILVLSNLNCPQNVSCQGYLPDKFSLIWAGYFQPLVYREKLAMVLQTSAEKIKILVGVEKSLKVF